jgi:hypothetical protein
MSKSTIARTKRRTAPADRKPKASPKPARSARHKATLAALCRPLAVPTFYLMADRNSPLSLRHLKLNPDCCVSWQFSDAPRALRDLNMFDLAGISRQPEFVTVVPDNMYFSHLPRTTAVIVKLTDGVIAFEAFE